MRAWEWDASYTPGEMLTNFTPIANQNIRAFLSPDNKTETILVAPKGYGKTLLLRKKATDLRLRHLGDDICIHPSNAATNVEALRIPGLDEKIYDYKWISRLKNHQQWSDLWTYAIGFLVCSNEGRRKKASQSAEALADDIDLLFGIEGFESLRKVDQHNLPSIEQDSHSDNLGARTVRNYFSIMILSWENRAQEYSQFFVKRVEPALDRMRTAHVLFLDSADEALNWEKSDVARIVSVSSESIWAAYPDQWVHFNMGLVDAIRRVRLMHGNIRVFSTLRTEVVNAFRGALGTQYEPMYVRLAYDKDELLQIFEKNIHLMSGHAEDRLCLATALTTEDASAHFVGIRKALHKPTGIEEPIFDAIIRHTRWTPRDLMIMGKALMKTPVEQRRRCTVTELDCIRETINAVGQGFFEAQQREAIPYWPARLNELILRFRTNVIHCLALRAVAPVTARDTANGCSFDYLYSQGLLGWIGSKAAGNSAKIHFLDGQNISARTKQLPKARWYALHPVLYPDLRERHGDDIDGYESSARALVGNQHEISSPAAIEVKLCGERGKITITGARVVHVPIESKTALVLAMITKCAVDRKALEMTGESILETYLQAAAQVSWLPKFPEDFDVNGDTSHTSNDWLDALWKTCKVGRHIETVLINNQWIPDAFGFTNPKSEHQSSDVDDDVAAKAAARKQNARPSDKGGKRRPRHHVRISWENGKISIEGILLTEISCHVTL